MNAKLLFAVGSFSLLAFSTVTTATCNPSLSEQIVGAERIIDSLRPDKAGQMRVFAADGSEYTAGQALWMKGQLRDIMRACESGDETSATAALRKVQDVLSEHHVSS